MRSLIILALALVAASRGLAAAPDRSIEVRNEHFRIVTDGDEKQARRVLGQFERIRWMFRALFPENNPDPVQPIVVVAAKDERTFRRFEPLSYLEKGQLHLAGVFMRVYDKNYVLLRLNAGFDHPFSPVYHEYTHLQFSSDSEWMPLWLNEGLAGFFQTTAIEDKNLTIGAPSSEDLLLLRSHPMIPLDMLFRVDRASPYYHEEQKGNMFYAESWALTHYLETSDRSLGTHLIKDYLDLERRGVDPVAAAEKAFGNLKQLEKHLADYVHANHYETFVLPISAAWAEPPHCPMRTLSPDETDALRADVLAGVHREAEARVLLESLLKAQPENAQAHESMGALEYRAGNPEAALRWYRDAVRLSSQNYFAYFSCASLAMSGQSSWDDPEIEQSLRTAVRLNPRYYPASQSLATLLFSFNRDRDAIAVLEEALRNAATPSDAGKAQTRITRIEEEAAERKAILAQAEQQNAGPATPAAEVRESGPKHPTEPARGAKHVARGIIRGVQCADPAIIDFRIEGSGKNVRVYSNDYTALEYTVLGFLPKGNLHPCEEFEGMKARVSYVESSDKSVDGQIVAMELRK